MADDSGIVQYFHCKQCFADKPANISMIDYSKYSVGYTATGGVRVWCDRHEAEITTI